MTIFRAVTIHSVTLRCLALVLFASRKLKRITTIVLILKLYYLFVSKNLQRLEKRIENCVLFAVFK